MSGDISIRFSRKVTIVSFILSVFVLYIHAKNLAYYNFGDVHGTLIYVLNQIMSETFGRVAVPFFFLQSGYWMFRYDIFEEKSDILKRKLKKKVVSLGIPYLIWNTFGLLFFIIMTHIPGMPFNIYGGQVVNITLKNIFNGIFLHGFYFPYWFMQDLIVLTVFSPVLVKLLRNRYMTYGATVVLFIFAMLGINTPVCQTNSILLFVIGGTLSVYHREYWEKTNSSFRETVFYILLFLILAAMKWLEIPYVSTIFSTVSPILFWKGCDLLRLMNVFEHEPSWFCKQSFFIYSAHIFLVEGISSIFSRVSTGMLWVSLSYMINPIISLALLYIAARVLTQRFPKLYGLLCGNRI